MTLANEIVDAGAVSYGDFTLKSGKTSSYYVDMRCLISNPSLLKKISKMIYEKTNDIKCIAGVPMGGIPYAIYISAIYSVPMVLIRKKPKEHGTCRLVEGNISKDTPITLIEDVVTTGNSLLNIIKLIEKEGFKINNIVVIVCRDEQGLENIIKLGYSVISCFNFKNTHLSAIESE